MPAASQHGMAELEHFVGYGGRYGSTVHYHPVETNVLIYSASSLVIIEDVTDPHKQEFLRGHDGEITALDVAQNGKLIASGQVGSPYKKGAVAPVVVWDFDNRQRYIEFAGLAHSVLCTRFSPDGRFLMATGANQMIIIWDVSTGEQVYSRKTESPCFVGAWGPIQDTGRYPSYTLCTTYDNQVLVHTLAFDIASMCYKPTSDVVQFPSSGLQRKHLSGLVRGEFLLTGTAAGDVCVFSLKHKVFRTALPVCNNGTTGITAFGDVVYVSGGDGRVKALKGYDTHWDVLAENVLEAGISALSVSSDGAELVCGTKNGKLFRLLSSDLTATLQAISHTDEVTHVAFGTSSDAVCSVSRAGEVLVIDLSDYLPIMTIRTSTPARSAVCCSATRQGEAGEVIVGYEDGFIRSWKLQRGVQHMLWELHAHRGGVHVVRETVNFIVTGGHDCAVRFWHRTTRELLATFHCHAKPITDIVVDNQSPHIVHSGSEDRLCVTYDLKQNKALVQHTTPSSNITGLTQRKDREHEVISCTMDGKLLFWDIDYPDPVGCMEAPSMGTRFRCCEISPTGRYVAVGTDDAQLLLYDLMSCSCIQVLEAHSQSIVNLRWTPDQKQIVTGGKDGCLAVWNFFET
jgi:WD40 repeat protein